MERDDAFKKQAIHNIAKYPKAYARNWAANVGRVLFSYPFSFAPQSLTTYFYLAPNMFIVVLFLVSLIPGALRPHAMPFELWFLLAFGVIAFAGSTLISGNEEQFMPLVPILSVWVGLVAVRRYCESNLRHCHRYLVCLQPQPIHERPRAIPATFRFCDRAKAWLCCLC